MKNRKTHDTLGQQLVQCCHYVTLHTNSQTSSDNSITYTTLGNFGKISKYRSVSSIEIHVGIYDMRMCFCQLMAVNISIVLTVCGDVMFTRLLQQIKGYFDNIMCLYTM